MSKHSSFSGAGARVWFFFLLAFTGAGFCHAEITATTVSPASPAQIAGAEPDSATRATEMFRTGKAVVRSLRGTADYAVRAGQWKPLKVGTILYPGATIRTHENTQVDLYLGVNGPLVRLTPNTLLEIETLRYSGKGEDLLVQTILSVPRGSVLANFHKASPESHYEIKTPQTTSTILK